MTDQSIGIFDLIVWQKLWIPVVTIIAFMPEDHTELLSPALKVNSTALIHFFIVIVFMTYLTCIEMFLLARR